MDDRTRDANVEKDADKAPILGTTPANAFLQRIASPLAKVESAGAFSVDQKQSYDVTSITFDGKPAITTAPQNQSTPINIDQNPSINTENEIKHLEEETKIENKKLWKDKEDEYFELERAGNDIANLTEDEVKERDGLLSKAKRLLEQSEDTPTQEKLKAIDEAFDKITNFLSSWYHIGNDTQDTVIDPQTGPSVLASSPILPPDPIKNTFEEFSESQFRVTRIFTIKWDKQTKKYIIYREFDAPGHWKYLDKPITLNKIEGGLYTSSNILLKEYGDFVSSISSEELKQRHHSLVLAKVDLITAIEERRWDLVSDLQKKLHEELEKAKNPPAVAQIPAQPTGSPSAPPTSSSQDPNTPVTSSSTTGGIGAPPLPPTPPGGNGGTPENGPKGPDREPRLDVAGGWPITIFKKEIGGTKGTRGRIEWYKVVGKTDEPLLDANSWNTYYEEFDLLFKDYRDIMLTGNTLVREKKKTALKSLIIAKNNVVDAIADGDLEKAKNLTHIFTGELIEAEGLWKVEGVKLSESQEKDKEKKKQEEFLKIELKKEKDSFDALKKRGEDIRYGLSSQLEKDHVELEINALLEEINDAETSITKDKITNIKSNLERFTGILDTYEKKINAIYGKTLRPTRPALKRITLLKPGGQKEEIDGADQYIKQRELEEREKKEREEKERSEALTKKFTEEHEAEFSLGPQAYYFKYIIQNKKGVVPTMEERNVITAVIRDGMNSGMLSKKEIEELERKYQIHTNQIDPTTSRFSQRYSPTAEANDKLAQKTLKEDKNLEEGMTDAEIMAHRGYPPYLDVGNNLHTKGMINAKNDEETPSPPHAEPLNTQAQEKVDSSSPDTLPQTPEANPSQEKKLKAVGIMHDKLTKYFGNDWVRFFGMVALVGATAGTAYLTMKEPEKTKIQQVQKISWMDYLTPEREAFLKDFRKMDTDTLLATYMPLSVSKANAASLDAAKKWEIEKVFNEEGAYGLTIDKQKEVSKFLTLLRDTYATTEAVKQALGTSGKRLYNDPDTGWAFSPKKTLENYINDMKRGVYNGDAFDRQNTLLP